jgi:hypothetical protein
MSGRADLNVNFGLGRAGHELVAAGAADVSVDVLGMYTGLHSVIECSGAPLEAGVTTSGDLAKYLT